MARGQAFYKTIFGWEFSTPPNMEEGSYAMFTKPDTRLSGGFLLVKEEDMLQPKVDAQGQGQATNRITIRVEEVEAALKSIEAVGGKTIMYAGFFFGIFDIQVWCLIRVLSSPKFKIGPEMGFVGIFRDTEGNINSVWSKD